MKLQIYGTLVGVLGPILIAFTLLSCKSEEDANEKALTKILEEIDRGEWAMIGVQNEKLPSEEDIAKGVEKAILDVLMKEFGFRFDVKELKVFHIYEDSYRGFLHTNKVGLHHTMYSFWFNSNGSYFFIQNWTEEHVDYSLEEL